MKNIKMFFMRHVGLILTMIAGYAGMNASSEFDCMVTKKAFIDMCKTYQIDDDFVQDYMTANNPIFKDVLQVCVSARYGYQVDYRYAGFDNQKKYQNEFATEILVDLDNIKKVASQVRCDQVRKDFITGLASVQTEENKAAVIKAFEGSLADCK